MTLESIVVKELLKDIERSNTPRQDFDLQALVDNKISVYGASGSGLRRAVQKKFDQVRRKPRNSYSKLLDRFQIPRGRAFERELRVHREKNGDDDDDDDDEESEDESEGLLLFRLPPKSNIHDVQAFFHHFSGWE